ncbi:hypothetical protein FRB96_006410 [Tulasnella sp. 330]|nr:hypothetical protein FRB96_006410 [Tulasnella sp. 330]
MPLLTETFSHDLEPNFPLKMMANRYTWSGSVASSSTSAKKERYKLWEPVLETLFVESHARDSPFIIEEAWAIDIPNHGASGAMNAEELRKPQYAEVFHCLDWGVATYDFLKTKLGVEDRTGKPSLKLIGVGHSIGAVTLMNIAHHHPNLFTSLTMFDPMSFPLAHKRVLDQVIHAFALAAHTRRDIWPSKKAAFKDLSGNRLYRNWDERSRTLFVEHGLHEHPAANFSYPFKGVTLRCTREQEAATCRGGHAMTLATIPFLLEITNATPSYVAFGANPDTLPKFVQDSVVEPQYSNFVQVTRIEDTGHLLVFEKPRECGEMLLNFIEHLTVNVIMPSAYVGETPSVDGGEGRRVQLKKKEGEQGAQRVAMMASRL